MQVQQGPQWIGYVVTAGVVALVLLLRLRGMRRSRRLRLETLWIVPAVYLAAAAALFAQHPPRGLLWLWLAIALAVGALIGWRRGKTMRIGVDPVTHALNQQASPAALLFIVLLILVRSGLRYEAAARGFDVATVTDLLVAFALGLFAATRAEMFVRARRLLAEARG